MQRMITMRRLRGFVWASLMGVMPALGAGAHVVPAAAAVGQPAVWRTYDLIVDLDKLPRTYTCDQLWYVFRGVLRRLGAPSDGLHILPYRCSSTASGDLRSPRVQVSFRMPSILHGTAVRWAQLRAVRRTVTVQPGEPKRLQPTDCRLLRQIRQTLLATLPVRVLSSDLRCSAGAHFGVTVRDWVAAPH